MLNAIIPGHLERLRFAHLIRFFQIVSDIIPFYSTTREGNGNLQRQRNIHYTLPYYHLLFKDVLPVPKQTLIPKLSILRTSRMPLNSLIKRKSKI